MKSDTGVLMFIKILNDIAYTCDGDESLKRKHFSTEILRGRIAKLKSRIVDKSDDLRGEGMKFIIQSKFFGI